jgi:hypothetical protein
MSAPPPESVKASLARRILELARLVAPEGRKAGREWVGHGPDGSKWGIVLSGDKVGCWQNFATGSAGRSGLSLIRDAFCRGDHVEAWKWALNWLGEDATTTRPEPVPVPDRPREPHRGALALYLHAEPFAWHNPVGRYLVARGIFEDRFPRPLGALRFHPNCRHHESGHALPAMVAAVVDPLEPRRHLATHRTYLAESEGRWRKASVPSAKMMLGPSLGGVVPLTCGASGKGLGDVPYGDCALLGEGIENTLTAAQWLPERRAIAYVSAGNLASLNLPIAIRDILLICDRDGENQQVTRARDWTAAHWKLQEGRRVEYWRPPMGAKDANAFWLGELANGP